MKFKGFCCVLALVFLALPASAQLVPYSQDFEGLLDTTADQPAQTALGDDGWLVFVNRFTSGGAYIDGYGPNPAPNGGFGGPGYSAVVLGESGTGQGLKVLSVYSNYEDPNHGNGSGALIETNVFQEQIIGADDVGKTCTFAWEHKRGNIEGSTTANAFFKVINSGNFATEANPLVDTTSLTTDWSGDSLSITIDAAWVGYFLQFGYANTASNGEGSGNFQDNVSFSCEGDPQQVPAASNTMLLVFLGLLGTALMLVIARTATRRVTA